MFFEPYLAIPGSIQPSSIYRHFKGGYYVVHAVASREESGEEVVVYQSLQTGQLFTRPLTSFMEKVPEDKENPTGQFHRFERVVEFNNQLSLISTENLVKELERRSDNPFAGIKSVTNSSQVWREDYLVGEFVQDYVDDTLTVEDFDVRTVHDSIEDARDSASKELFRSCASILKRVFLKVDP